MRRLESKIESSSSSSSGNGIIATILEIIQTTGGGVSMIRIMNRTRLAFQQLDEYLLLMVMNDLIIYDRATKTYSITKKGVDFLKAYTQVHTFYEVIDEEIGL
jgi:predicted transcriptional regulator